MNVVVDTNVFVSSFFGGNPLRVVNLWKEGALTLCLSPAIMEEYMQTMESMKHKNAELHGELFRLFAKGFNTLYTAKTPVIKIVAADPDDNKFIECAVALNAAYIITGDKALLDIKKYMTIQIVTPRRFLDEFMKDA